MLGAGSWGTALAIHLGRLGKSVRLWGRDSNLIGRIRQERRNEAYLPGVPLPPSVMPTASLDDAVRHAECLVSAVPSQGTRALLRRAKPFLEADTIIVSAAKGFELGSLSRLSEVITEELGASQPVAVLSGPSFAAELARGRPTAVLVASRQQDVSSAVQHEFRAASCLRLYGSDDVAGVEVGGAMKNVIAIAAGVVEGLELGPNAMAALITRGLAEISRLAEALGGRRETMAGLSGLGDLILTCTGGLSRNWQVGVELGRGHALDQVLAGMHSVAEGVKTTEAALELGRQHKVDLPISSQMDAVLQGRTHVKVAVESLMLRRQRMETDESYLGEVGESVTSRAPDSAPLCES